MGVCACLTRGLGVSAASATQTEEFERWQLVAYEPLRFEIEKLHIGDEAQQNGQRDRYRQTKPNHATVRAIRV